jgi:hypothetical protein
MALAVGLMATLAGGTACRSDHPADATMTASPSTTPMERRTLGEGGVVSPDADSLPRMLSRYDNVVVGRVSGVLQAFDPRPGFLGATPPAPIDVVTLQPEALTRPPGNGSSVYAVDVLRVIGPSDVKAGDSIAILQGGGVFKGVAYEYGDDPVIEVGATYLFFLNQWEPPFPHPWGVTFGSPAFGRFPLYAAGRAQAVNSTWAKYGATAAIAGLTVDEVAAKVAAALPLVPPRPPTPSSPPVAPRATRTATPGVVTATLSPTPTS